MASFEERLAAIEHDSAELKQKVELQTIAIGALVNKATLERLNEKNDATFNALMAHDKFTNQQLAEIREELEVDVAGKIAGLQTEMRQGLRDVKDDMNARFDQVLAMLAKLSPNLDQEV